MGDKKGTSALGIWRACAILCAIGCLVMAIVLIVLLTKDKDDKDTSTNGHVTDDGTNGANTRGMPCPPDG